MSGFADRDPSLPVVERLERALAPVEVFRRLSGLPHVIFFDSALRHPTLGRYSFVAADPVKWLEVGNDAAAGFAAFAKEVALLPRHVDPELPPFQGGWAGVFGYELASVFERVPTAHIDEFCLPRLAVGLYDVVVAFDHQLDAAWLISQGLPELDDDARHERAESRLARFRNLLASGANGEANMTASSLVPTLEELAPQHAIPGHHALTSNFSAEGYRRAVQQAIDYIYAGDIFQVNLSQRLLHPAKATSNELYTRLRMRNPAPFAGYLDGGAWQVASASPERFMRVAGRQVETRPIKGTRGRARRPEADLFAGDDLRASAKDRAENIMIVDLLRNDLSRTCMADSVCVSQLCGLEIYEYVQHLVSVVEGRLRPGFSTLDVVRCAFPGGSITGAPKIRAMEIIAELEPTVRGPYCGALGYLGVGEQMDTNILIRTITSAAGWWQLPVGGGIVAQSNPQQEYDETWHKATGLLQALSR